MTEPPLTDEPPCEEPPADGPSPKGNPLTRFLATRWRCRKTRLGIRTCTLYIASLIIFFGYALPTLLSEERIVAGATRIVSVLIGSPVSATSYQFGFDAGPTLDLTGAAIIDRNGEPAVRAERVSLTFDILRSLIRGPSLSLLVLKEPVIDLTRDAEGIFNLPLFDRLFGADDTSTTAAPLPSGEVRITGGMVAWTDHAVGPTVVSLRLENVQASLLDHTLTGQNPFKLSFVHHFDQRESAVNLEGIIGEDEHEADVDIRDIPLDTYWPYLKSILPFKKLSSAVSLKGKVTIANNGDFSSEGRLQFDKVSLFYPEAYSQKMSRQRLAVEFRAKGVGDVATIEKAYLTAGPLALLVSGAIDGYRSDDPELDLRLNMAPIDLEEVRLLAPDRFMTPVQTSFLKETVRGGKVSLSDVSYQGPASLLKQIHTTETRSRFKGQFRVTDGAVRFERLTYPFDRINGTATFDGDRLTLEGIEGRYGHSTITGAHGTVEKIHQWPTYNVTFAADLDLNEARQILAQKVTSPSFRQKILDVEEISGDVLLDLTVAGDTQAPVESLSVTGDMRLTNVTMRHSYLGLIHHLNGHVTGDRSLFHLEKITWLAASSPFVMTGALRDVFKPNPSFDIKLGATPHLADLNQIPFLAPRHPLIYPEGFAQIDMRLHGGFDRFAIEHTVDLTSAGFGWRSVIDKHPGKVVITRFAGEMEGERLSIGRLDLTVGKAKAVVTGAIGSLIQGKGFNLTVTSDHIEADDIDDFFGFMDDIDGQGTAKGAITIQHTPGEVPQLGGRVAITNGRFKLPLFVAPFHEVNGAFELGGSHVFLKGVTGRFGRAHFALEGDAALSSTIPLFTLNVRADGLDLYDFFGAPTWESTPTEPVAATVPLPEPVEEVSYGQNYFDAPWRIAIHSDSGTIGFLTYQNLDTVVTYKNGIFYIEPLTFEGHGGYWNAPLSITMEEDWNLLFEGKADVRDLAIDRYLVEAVNGWEMLDGDFTLQGKYEARGYLFYDIMRSLEGEVDVSSGSGVIRKFAMLSKIFSLLNVSQYFRLKAPDLAADGLPFDHVLGSFTLHKGIAHTDDLRVESEAIRLRGRGGYDIATGDVDMVVTAAPFVTIDRLVSAIPVAGYVLAGEEKSFLASSFTVTGALGNPTVTAIPFESLAVGTLGILKRFVTLPVKAVELLEEQDEPTVDNGHDDIN